MVGHFVRLKVRLVRATLRSAGIAGRVEVALAVVLAVVIGGLLGLGFLSIRAVSDRYADTALAGALGLLFLVWVLGPILTTGSEGTLEVDKLILLPLRPMALMPGLLAAAMVGGGGIASALMLLGALGATVTLSPLALVAALAGVVAIANCVAASRVLATAISGVRSRRWRDVALFVGPVLGIVLNLGVQLASRAAQRSEAVPGPLATTLELAARMAPTGPPALAMAAARRGDVLVAVAGVVGGTGWLLVLLWLWWRAVQRVLTMAPAPAGPKRRSGRVGLFPRFAAFLPRNRLGAVAAKELRVLWRDPRQRAALLATLLPGLLPLVSSGVLFTRSRGLVLLAAGAGFMAGATATNLYGFDASRHWTNVASGEDARSDLVGKVLSRLLWSAPLSVLVGVVIAARTGGWGLLPPALALGVGAFGIALGPAAVLSVMAAYPMPESSNIYSSGAMGQGLRAGLTAIVLLLVCGAASLPFTLGMARNQDEPATLALISAAALATGAVVAATGLAIAIRRATGRQPELLERLSARHAA